jgi:AraC-like DNA-binding protein
MAAASVQRGTAGRVPCYRAATFCSVRACHIDTLPLAFTVIDAAIRGTLLALLLLLAVLMLRDRPRSRVPRVGIAMALGLCVQVVSSTPLFEAEVSRLWQAPLVAVSVGNAVLFWLFVRTLFDDEFELRPVHFALWLAVAALSGLNCAFLAGSHQAVALYAMAVQRAVPLVFALLAAAAAASHWGADLVEGRRRLRGFIVITGIAYTVVVLVGRLGSDRGHLTAVAASTEVIGLLLIVAVVAWRLLRLGGADLFPAGATLPGVMPCGPSGAEDRVSPDEAERAQAPIDPAEERLAEALRRVMADEFAYRSEDLSVATLAARLSVPEYRLRRLINRRLGQRNFNAYVNGFRLEEARASLSDPAKREVPILTIALDAGFQSVGPFNRTFKSVTGLTPSDFRRQKLAES